MDPGCLFMIAESAAQQT